MARRTPGHMYAAYCSPGADAARLSQSRLILPNPGDLRGWSAKIGMRPAQAVAIDREDAWKR